MRRTRRRAPPSKGEVTIGGASGPWGRLDLAVADEEIKKNLAKSPVVQAPVHQPSKIQIWADDVIACLIDAHPDSLRALPELAASCGMREGEPFASHSKTLILMRRSSGSVGRLRDSIAYTYSHCRRMTVSESSRYRTGTSCRQAACREVPAPAVHPPVGKTRRETAHVQHPVPLAHRRPAHQSPKLLRDDLEARPGQGRRDRRTCEGWAQPSSLRHHPQGRHLPASPLLRQCHARGGISVKELAEYLGHSDPAFTLRVYAHMLSCSHDRARSHQ